MFSLSDTIVDTVEKLAELHDLLQFKSKACRQESVLADSLAACSQLLGTASDQLLADIVHALSQRDFPFTHKIKPLSREPEKPLATLQRAITLFPSDHIPDDDLMLLGMLERMETCRNTVEDYLNNKERYLAPLSEHPKQVLDYLITVAWND